MHTATMMLLLTIPRVTPFQTFLPMWYGTGEVGLFRADEQASPTNTRIWLAECLDGYTYVTWELDKDFHYTIDRTQLRHLTVTNKQDAAPVVLTGSGWTATNVTAAAYLGTYGSSITTGDYATMTTPANATTVGAWGIVGGGFAGMALVTIDNDNTLANLLPTAQQLVDNGTLASLGTLAPTDRLWDMHLADYQWKEFANSLTPGSHVIKITNTGLKNVSANFSRMFIAGIGYGGANIGTLNTTGARLVSSGIQLDGADAIMLSHSARPNGATNYEWMGHQASFANAVVSFSIDGVVQSLTQNQYIGGLTVTVTLTMDLRHPETGATNVGQWAVTLTLTKQGLRMQHTLTWLMNNLSIATAYPAMLGMDSAYSDRGHNLALISDETLTSHDDSVNCNARSTAVMLWDSGGIVGTMLQVNNLASVNGWQNATDKGLWVSEFSALPLNKAYLTRASTAQSVNSGDVWTCDVTYHVQVFSDADAALANKGKLL